MKNDYNTDRLYWIHCRKKYDISLWESIKFTWTRNWTNFWIWFWYKLDRCPECKKKIFWEHDYEAIDGYIIWEDDLPYHVDKDQDWECEGVC